MARPTLPLVATTVSPRPPPSCLSFSYRDTAPPRSRTLLPHFSSSNTSINSPGRPSQPEDFTKTPLEKSIDELQRVKARVRDSFTRMNQTHELFESDLEETSRIVSSLEAEQRSLTQVYANLLDFSTRQIQRCFRGHTGRRLFRQALVVRAVLRVQRKFREFYRRREEMRKKSRVLCRKILRGLRGVHVRDRHELSHTELLTRVGHNLQVEAQWRTAMGVKDTESNLITALYRKKYVRQRLGAMFRHLFWLHSIGKYWKSLLPQPGSIAPADTFSEQEQEQVDSILVDDWAFGDGMDEIDTSQQKIVIVAPRGRRQGGASNSFTRAVHSQRMHTQRMREGHVKRDAPPRPQNPQSLRNDFDRRGRQAVRDLQQKKDDELRKEEETVRRMGQSKK